eukprot:4286023-Prymnesium_polylepis.1
MNGNSIGVSGRGGGVTCRGGSLPPYSFCRWRRRAWLTTTSHLMRRRARRASAHSRSRSQR